MSTARYRILLVDDDAIDRLAFLRHVRNEALPYDCRTAGSIAEGRIALASAPCDLVLLDRELPDGLGFELLPELKSIPVIFVTGSDSPEDAVRALKEGAADYLLKDQDRNYLKLMPIAVERALGQARDRAALRETQELLRQTYNEAPIGIAFVSLGGTFLRVNRALCDIFGVPESEFLARGFELVFQTPPDAQWTAGLGACQKLERSGRRGDGKELALQFDIVLVPDGRGLDPTYVAQIQDIGDRKRAEAALLEASHRAGMAEVATGVLHNVANVLTSVNLTSSLLVEGLAKSKSSNLQRVVAMLGSHKADLGSFLSDDRVGKLIPDYLTHLSEQLAGEHTAVLKELASLRAAVEHLMAIVSAQQSHSRVGTEPQRIAVADFVANGVRLALAGAHSSLRIVQEVHAGLTVTVDPHRALQILINLIRNAAQASATSTQEEKILTIRANAADHRVRIDVIDNGIGIDPANLGRIFSRGFTTKQDGHGFGLHSSLLAAEGLGGTLSVYSEGLGQGATFTLELPDIAA